MKKTGYERIGMGGIYYYDDGQEVYTNKEVEDWVNDEDYNAANYYSNEIIAGNNARADKLIRQLRRFAVENNDKEIDWNSNREDKYYIYFNYKLKSCIIASIDIVRDFGQIYFSSKEVAQKAIETFHDELIWYFTEYCDHIVYEKDESVVEGCDLCKSSRLDTVGIGNNRIWFCGGNTKPKDEERVKFCPKCGRKLVDE